MQSIFDFIIKPKNKRYSNTKQIDGSELLLNSEISNHQYVSRNGIVLGLPKAEKTNIKIATPKIEYLNALICCSLLNGFFLNGIITSWTNIEAQECK